MNKKTYLLTILMLFIVNNFDLNANILNNKKELIKNSNYFSNYLSGNISLKKK